jgi:hypothetical protein
MGGAELFLPLVGKEEVLVLRFGIAAESVPRSGLYTASGSLGITGNFTSKEIFVG